MAISKQEIISQPLSKIQLRLVEKAEECIDQLLNREYCPGIKVAYATKESSRVLMELKKIYEDKGWIVKITENIPLSCKTLEFS